MSRTARLAVAGTVVALVAGVAVATTTFRGDAPRLTLDGERFQPELALTAEARRRGLMNRDPAPVDGMLFVFSSDVEQSFWMKDTLVPLSIVFFDAEGLAVRRLEMTPCRSAACPLYRPSTPYRYALELPASDVRSAKRIGPRGEIARLSREAS